MKKIIGAIAVLLLSTSSFSNSISITGPVAEQLYTLIPKTPLKQVFNRPMNIKVIGGGYACSERTVSNDNPAAGAFEYFCIVPPANNNKVRLSDNVAKLLFNAMEGQGRDSVTTSRNATIYIRSKGAISCYEQEYVGGAITNKCVITL